MSFSLLSSQNCTLARFGSDADGGYLMCQNLIEELGSAYWYGIGSNDEFGCDVSTRYNVPVHQYDCFDPARPVCPTGKFVFHNECIGGRRGSSRLAYFRHAGEPHRQQRRQRQAADREDRRGRRGVGFAHGDAGRHPRPHRSNADGASWRRRPALSGDSSEAQTNLLSWSTSISTTTRAPRTLAPLPAWAYQVLLVNKRIGVLDPTKGTPPSSPLNMADNRREPDCQLAQAAPAR